MQGGTCRPPTSRCLTSPAVAAQGAAAGTPMAAFRETQTKWVQSAAALLPAKAAMTQPHAATACGAGTRRCVRPGARCSLRCSWVHAPRAKGHPLAPPPPFARMCACRVVVEFLKSSQGVHRVVRLNHSEGGLPPQLFGRVDLVRGICGARGGGGPCSARAAQPPLRADGRLRAALAARWHAAPCPPAPLHAVCSRSGRPS